MLSTTTHRESLPFIALQSAVASLSLCCFSTYRQYELQTQGANKAQPKSIIARGFVLKEDENLDGTDARVEDPNCIIPRLRSETESSIGQDATERAIRELEESEEQNAGNELVDVNPFSAHSCLDGDTGA